MKKKFEDLLIEHCSPTLAGVKTANLFCFNAETDEDIFETSALWNLRLNKYGIFLNVIKKCYLPNHYLIYVYRENFLMQDLNNYEVQDFLSRYGYENCSEIDDFMLVLAEKLRNNSDFPHEIGLFLGYPLNDVVGFIENKGKNYCFCGFWKVYENPQEALKCFEQYKKCTSVYKKLYQNGRSIIQLTVAA